MNTHTTNKLPVFTARDRLVKAREFAGMTQADMADAIGKGVRSIARYESSDTPPHTIVLAYAYATGVPAWWIEHGDEDEEDGKGARPVTQREYPCWTLDSFPLAA
jgi:transcriptional regulator with XRE-family HTH domain